MDDDFDGQEPVQPLVWMRTIRDDTDLTAGTLNVLVMLALRMRKDGAGFASQEQLADDAGVSESTVRRALQKARDLGYVVRTRRGHRINDDVSVASEYRLTTPPQPVTGDTLAGATQPVTGARLDAGAVPPHTPPDTPSQPVISKANRSSEHTQPVTGDRPRGLHPEVLSPRVPDQGSGASSDAASPTSRSEVADLAAALLADQHGIDPDSPSDVWKNWHDATPTEKARAFGEARTRLHDQQRETTDVA